MHSVDGQRGLKPFDGVLEDGLKTWPIELFPCLTVRGR
jgi:hypothetical protein